MSQPPTVVVEHEQAVLTLARCDIFKGGDVVLYPLVGLMERPVPVDLCQLVDKVLG